MYKYSLEQEVTVTYPSGRERDGIVARRSTLPGSEPNGHVLKRYAVLFTNDQADVLIPEYWISPLKQRKLDHV
jgi:hypothetical protein